MPQPSAAPSHKLRRWSFHVATAMSLALALLTGGLWVRSLRTLDWVWTDTFHPSQWVLASRGGGFAISFTGSDLTDWPPDWELDQWPGLPLEVGGHLRFSYTRLPAGWALELPHWPFVALFLMLPGWWGLALWRRRRRLRERGFQVVVTNASPENDPPPVSFTGGGGSS